MLSALLIALVLITGQGGAVARGMAGAVGMAELCAGSSAVMVYIDAQGQPTAPPHLCPDTALSLLDVATSNVKVGLVQQLVSPMQADIAPKVVVAVHQVQRSARGPPV
jgi:hypothetical protein